MRADQRRSGEPSRILLVVDDCGPGDALRISFCLDAVRRRFPVAELVLLVGEEAHPEFVNSPTFDRTVVTRLYRRHGRWVRTHRWWKVRHLVTLARQLGTGYQRLIAFNWGSTLLHILMWVVGRNGRRVGYARSFASLLTDNLGPYRVALAKVDYIQQSLALVRAAGIDPTIARPAVAYAPRDLVDVDHLLERNCVLACTPFIVLHPGSHWPCQQWLPERWSRLADELVHRYGAQIIFTGGASEDAHIRKIRARMQTRSTSLVGQTTLPQLAALLSRAQLCVCVNSAVFELTQSAAVPTIVLAGPSQPYVVSANGRSAVVINQTPLETRMAINRSRRRLMEGRQPECRNYACSLAYLRDIQLTDVLRALDQMLPSAVVRMA